MTKISKTYNQLFELNSIAGGYLARHKANENKLCEKIRQLANKQLKPHFDELNENDESLRIDHCAVDPVTKIILKDKDGNYQFTKDGLKAFGKDCKLYRETEVQLHARIIEDVPDDLTDYEIEAFAGILIPAEYTKPIELQVEKTE